MLDFELGLLLRQLTAVETVNDLPLDLAEPLGRGIGEGRAPGLPESVHRAELRRPHRAPRRE